MAAQSGGGHGGSVQAWIACLIIIAGFIIGGVALIYWNWPVFWVGVGVTAVGCIYGRAINIMEEVTEYGGASGGGSGDPESASVVGR